MKNVCAGVLLMAGCNLGVVGCNSVNANPPANGYVLLFEDNFDGNKVNETVWNYRLDRRGGEANFSDINGLNLKQNCSVADGLLNVKVDQELINSKQENTGGGLISKKRFGYGYYECRYRPYMKGSGGVHCAFWQRGTTNTVLGKQNVDATNPINNVIFEIDSSEVDNPHWVGTNNLYVVIAGKNSMDGVPWPARFHIPITPLDGGWFLDAYEYTPSHVIFYDNGKEVARVKYDAVRGQQEVWLTALNGFGKIRDTSIYPGTASFDYFRYYAKDYPGANLLANEGFEYNMDRIDPQTPIAWCEAGDLDASKVETGNAFRDNTKLRHASDKAYKVTTRQTLQHIMDGTYTASAMVRSSGGQHAAKFQVLGNGADEKSVDINASDQWVRVIIPEVTVKGHTATIAITSDADAGQWLEVDDVQFMKPPLPGQVIPEPKPFGTVRDPIWYALNEGPMSFADGRFLLFGREVGYGDAMTVSFKFKADRKAVQLPIERTPKKGNSGWAVMLTEKGELSFRIGSLESFTEVLVPDAYDAGKLVSVVCVFDHGKASVYIDGKLAKTVLDIKQDTKDKTAAGTCGQPRAYPKKYQFTGELQDIFIHNRALPGTGAK